MHFRLTLKLQKNAAPDSFEFGRGVVMLLEGIETYGSINKATKRMGMAYSKAWRIINETENAFGVRLIERDGARGSALTDEARELIAHYREALSAAENAAETVIRQYYPE